MYLIYCPSVRFIRLCPLNKPNYIFSRQASLTRQAFLLTPGIRREKTLTPKSSAMKSYVKLMRHPQH